MQLVRIVLILPGILGLVSSPLAAGGIWPENLRCEHLIDPLGIDCTAPRLSWTLKAAAVSQRGEEQSAYHIIVAASLEKLAADRGDLWDSGKVLSANCAEIAYEGRKLDSFERCYWKVRVWDQGGTPSNWTEPATWTMAVLDPNLWQGKWLGYSGPSPSPAPAPAPGDKPWGQKAPSPLLRKSFEITRPIARATAMICGLGYYELRLNGKKVGDRVLEPKFTRYDRRVLYTLYDVTAELRDGRNAVGIMLGNGFYNQHAEDIWGFHKAPWRGEPAMLFQLRLDYRDGTSETIVSDETWRASTGPVVHDGIRNGEDYDARLELPGWDNADFDDSAWARPQVVPGPSGKLRAAAVPPIRVIETITPVAVAAAKSGGFVIDMGQNFAGWAQLRVSGSAGTRITMRYGERVDASGKFKRPWLAGGVKQGPFQTDAYTLKGGSEEVWEPRFTYHGFRYVEVTGFPGRPTPQNLRGRVVHTSFEPAGSFECSDELLNTIQRMTLWSYRSNYVGIPTDCPQREKNGWTGDAHLAAEQAMYNFYNIAAYEEWMNDFKDEQRENGQLPAIMPTPGCGYGWGSGPAWDSAYLIIPWYLYQYYGDTRVLAEHYDGMKRYVDYLTRCSKNGIVKLGLGDWLSLKTTTPVELTSTSYYFVDALILSKIATILGNETDARAYAALADEIRSAVRQKFCGPDGTVANNSQTALSCVLHQGLATPEEKEAILRRLAANVEAADGHIDAGILGAKYLFRSLTDGGHEDLAYRVATQTTPPSYGHWVRQGATTLCEDWRDVSSRNHVMFGDISAWFYQALAGILLDPDRPAFKHFVIRPQPAGDLTWVRARHESIYGLIEVAWRRAQGTFSLDVTVPVSTTATVYVPAADAASVSEGGRPAAEAPGVRFLRLAEGTAIYEVGSGSYAFVSSSGSP